jgi:hypothetical protein
VRTLPIQLHFDSLFHALLGQGKEGAEVDTELQEKMTQQMQTTMDALYGKDLRVSLVASEGYALIAFRHDAAELRADLARLRTPAAPRPEMQRLLRRVEPGALGFAYHLDFGNTLAQVFEAVERVVPGTGHAFPFSNAVLDAWGSVRGSTWTFGMAMGLAQVVEFARKAQELEKK